MIDRFEERGGRKAGGRLAICVGDGCLGSPMAGVRTSNQNV